MLQKVLFSGTLIPLGARSNARDSRILIHAREHERAMHDIMQSCMRSSTSPNTHQQPKLPLEAEDSGGSSSTLKESKHFYSP